jgi:hypothetical protein
MKRCPSTADLRKRVSAMLPGVDLPEVILEVMGWVPEFTAAFTLASGGQTRLDDLHVSVAAGLTAQALNIGYTPVAKRARPRWSPPVWRTCPFHGDHPFLGFNGKGIPWA